MKPVAVYTTFVSKAKACGMTAPGLRKFLASRRRPNGLPDGDWTDEHVEMVKAARKPKNPKGSTERKELALARKYELQAAQLSGKLVMREAVRTAMVSMAFAWRKAVMDIPARIAAKFSGDVAQRIQMCADAECRSALNTLASQEPDLARGDPQA